MATLALDRLDEELAEDTEIVPFLEWPEFLQRFRWSQGEHVAAIASTGAGKTTLLRAILPLRRYVVALATKNRDDVMKALQSDGFVVQKEWEPVPAAWPRVILKPGLANSDDMRRQAGVFKHALDDAFATGGWTIFADEVRYLTQNLDLKRELELIWLQGRSAGTTVVGATQRPAWVPLELYNASTHIFLWAENDKRNLDRLSELDGANTDLIKWQLRRLREFECLYVCTRKRAGLTMARTIAPKGM